MAEEITIRECKSVVDYDACISLQREAFNLPDQELSPRRHLIVSRQAGGWTLGAFAEDRMVGFVHHLAAVNGNEIFGYSHMMGVAVDYQNKGVGAKLKWAQRQRALAEGRDFIKWTWEPIRARNAHFNLNRLGVVIEGYSENFYGTDYGSDYAGQLQGSPGIDSDRVFASWYLRSERVIKCSEGGFGSPAESPVESVHIPANWPQLVQSDPAEAKCELLRVRAGFNSALAAGLVCAGFDRQAEKPAYLFYERDQVLV
jgi:predicted GNAT superfamily acetyltransferase